MENCTVDKNLPARPHLDHLRRQAKALLAALQTGDRDAIATILEHLPAAKGMSADQAPHAGFRLADAQSAIARKSGFGSWPKLARHVEQLRSLEGQWSIASLEVDGSAMARVSLGSSRFRSVKSIRGVSQRAALSRLAWLIGAPGLRRDGRSAAA